MSGTRSARSTSRTLGRTTTALLAGLLALSLCGCPPDKSPNRARGTRQTHTTVSLPREGVYHPVAAGETLSSICAVYQKSSDAIAKVNGISPGQALRPGQRVFIPGVRNVIRTAPPRDTRWPDLVPYRGSRAARMIRPVQGSVVVRYHQMVQGAPSDGIGIAAELGAPVWAAQDGVVSFANDDFFGVGKIILIHHASGQYTLYGHLHEPLVKIGDRVKQGDVIARAGTTGRTERPQLHFRIYQQGDPVDPLKYLAD